MTQPYVISGASMKPLFPHGTRILVKPLAAVSETLKPGMVVLVRNAQNLPPLAHRIIKATGESKPRYLIQGDNLAAPDGWVEKHDILGVVARRFRHGRWHPIPTWEDKLLWRLLPLRRKVFGVARRLGSPVLFLVRKLFSRSHAK